MNKILLLIFCIILSCESSKHEKRPVIEKPKLTIKLDNTQLLVSEIINDLDEPWEIIWGQDEHLWFTEKKGNIMRMNPITGGLKTVLNIKEVYSEGLTPGLLGMVLHPDFKNNPYVYLHYTYIDSTDTSLLDFKGNINIYRSKVMRYEYSIQKDTLINPEIILPNIPAFRAHNGSRLTISSDNKLLFALGDAMDFKNAQSTFTLPGKVLRINLDGSVPEDNPIPESYLYSMGHRNPQGLVAANGKIYASEHGPDNDDEINLIKPLSNYGWPFVEGLCDTDKEKAFCDSIRVTEPIYSWTPTIAPAGLDYYNHTAIPEWQNHLMLTTLKGCALWLLELNEAGDKIVNKKIYLQKQFGRLRDLCVSSNGEIYLITSNSDWHIPRYKWMYDNVPVEGNDRIIKISRLKDYEQKKYEHLAVFTEDKEPAKMHVQTSPEKILYRNYCASCHMKRGEGIPNFVPPLTNTKTVANKEKFIETVLFGMSGEIEVNGEKYNDVMPGFADRLTDQEIKTLINFIRQVTGHKDSITTSNVEKIRKSRSF